MKKIIYATIFVVLSILNTANSQSIFTQPEMIFVAGGSFEMGSNHGEPNERPPHKVNLNSFYIGKFEVTQKLWQQVMGSNPSLSQDILTGTGNRMGGLKMSPYQVPQSAQSFKYP